MLKIADDETKEAIDLQHGSDVFHRALAYVKEGEKYFHVSNPEGEDYSLSYEDNNSMIPGADLDEKKRFFPPFYDYDENDVGGLCLDVFEGYESIYFETIDEYTIVLIGVLLKNTNLKIFFTDKKILLFYEISERLKNIDALPEKKPGEMFVSYGPHVGFINNDYSHLCPQALFYSVFFFRYLTDIPVDKINFVEVEVPERVGIGGLLTHFTMMKNAFEDKGFKTFLKPSSTRFPDDFISRYFNIEFTPKEANPDNTIYITDFDHCCASYLINKYKSVTIEKNILNKSFIGEMEEYREAVIGDKKCLGVLARGTDYAVGDYGAERHHATASDMIPLIRKWTEEYGYELIFLATEDQGILDEFMEAFPGKIRAIAQERHRKEDFKKGELIYEKERREMSGEEYINHLIDTSVNYFYALYILSSCSAFICSGQCNGWDTVLVFNGNLFERKRKFMIDIEGNPATEDFAYICDLHSGMAARNVIPNKNPLTITIGFKLKEGVSRESLKKALLDTLKVYPYFKRSIIFRNGKYIMTENPMEFVIMEKDRVIAPSMPEANFHMVTISYKGNSIKFGFDHAGTDGGAALRFLSTYFFYYFSDFNKMEYDVPDNVRSLKDIPINGQDEDAFLKVMPVLPEDGTDANKEAKTDKETFAPPEIKGNPPVTEFADGNRYLIALDGKSFIDYCKKLKGTPQSTLSLLVAKALEKPHKDNKKPIRITFPVSIRKAFGNEESLMSQIVAAEYVYDATSLNDDDKAIELTEDFRNKLKDITSKEGMNLLAGKMRIIIEQSKALRAKGMSDYVYAKALSSGDAPVNISMVGTIKLPKEYSDEIKEAYFYYLPRNGLSVHMLEAGDKFYIMWAQAGTDDTLVKYLVQHMKNLGIKGEIYDTVF